MSGWVHDVQYNSILTNLKSKSNHEFDYHLVIIEAMGRKDILFQVN